jgi:hypothetical protein
MACRITILFSDGQEFEAEVSDADMARFTHDSAHQWLGREFDEAGCVPGNPVGKLLAADKIVGLAKSRTRIVFQSRPPWVSDYLAATATALGRPVVTIDLGNETLGY